MPDQSPVPEASPLQLPTEHLSSLLTMRTWAKTTLEEERQRCLHLKAELEQRQSHILWLEQTLETTEKILPDTLLSMPIAGGHADSSSAIATPVKASQPPSPKQSTSVATPAAASRKQSASKQSSAEKPVAKPAVTPPPTAKVAKYIPTPQATAKATQPSSSAQKKGSPTKGKQGTASKSMKFSIRDVPFLAPYKGNSTVTQAIKALLEDHPDEIMDINQIIQRLFGTIPVSIQEQVRRRVTTDLSTGKDTFWQSVPGKRGFYQTLIK